MTGDIFKLSFAFSLTVSRVDTKELNKKNTFKQKCVVNPYILQTIQKLIVKTVCTVMQCPVILLLLFSFVSPLQFQVLVLFLGMASSDLWFASF